MSTDENASATLTAPEVVGEAPSEAEIKFLVEFIQSQKLQTLVLFIESTAAILGGIGLAVSGEKNCLAGPITVTGLVGLVTSLRNFSAIQHAENMLPSTEG